MAKTIINESGSPRSINTTTGPVVLQPGDSLPDDREVSDAERSAMDAIGFLSAPDPNARPLTPLEQHVGDPLVRDANDEALPDEDDAEVLALKDGNTADELRDIATQENVALETDDNKLDMSRKIIAARRG